MIWHGYEFGAQKEKIIINILLFGNNLNILNWIYIEDNTSRRSKDLTINFIHFFMLAMLFRLVMVNNLYFYPIRDCLIECWFLWVGIISIGYFYLNWSLFICFDLELSWCFHIYKQFFISQANSIHKWSLTNIYWAARGSIL